MTSVCKRWLCLLTALCLLALCACGQEASVPETDEPVPAEEVTPTPEPIMPDGPVDGDGIYDCFARAMTAMIPEVTLDVSKMTWEYGAENDLRNIYYTVLSNCPELKYTYDIQSTVTDGTAVCAFSYMPYKTGAYAAGIPEGSIPLDSLRAVMDAAQSMNGTAERLSIAITNPELSVESIQYALAQAGYGWICYDLSRDGTEILAGSPVGMTMEDCAAGIQESFTLGQAVVEELVSEDMAAREMAWVLYDYIARNVSYDFRYYSDRANMPYESTVALGALRDGLAICGGYAQAYQTLLDLAGIENYTVSGVSQGEYHMWNYVIIDGTGYYCDPTAQRGGGDSRFLKTAEELDAIGGYEWDRDRWPYSGL